MSSWARCLCALRIYAFAFQSRNSAVPQFRIVRLSDRPTPPPISLLQLAPLLLLACFAAQCLYVATHAPLSDEEVLYASPGPRWAGQEFSKPGDPYHSPLVYHIAQLPVRHGTVPWFDFIGPRYTYRWLLRLPFVIFGILRGASLWFVARRLFGRLPGAFALALYCFAPSMVAEGSHIWPDVLAAWGFFGAIFLTIASAHTLYASHDTILWHDRWRRPILMGIALGIAVSAQFTTWVALPLAIAFLLYLVPGRRREAAAMLAAAAAIAFVVFFMVYRFDFAGMRADVHAALVYAPPANAVQSRIDALLGSVRYTNPAFLTMLLAGSVTWIAWRRARWFGNTAPLIVLAAVPLLMPVYPWPESFRLWIPGIAFFFMFLGGVFADTLDSPRRKLALGVGLTLLLVDISFGLAKTFTTLAS